MPERRTQMNKTAAICTIKDKLYKFGEFISAPFDNKNIEYGRLYAVICKEKYFFQEDGKCRSGIHTVIYIGLADYDYNDEATEEDPETPEDRYFCNAFHVDDHYTEPYYLSFKDFRICGAFKLEEVKL